MKFEGLPACHTRHKHGKGDEKSDTETYNVGLSAKDTKKREQVSVARNEKD